LTIRLLHRDAGYQSGEQHMAFHCSLPARPVTIRYGVRLCCFAFWLASSCFVRHNYATAHSHQRPALTKLAGMDRLDGEKGQRGCIQHVCVPLDVPYVSHVFPVVD
jgi:hypothetical protein